MNKKRTKSNIISQDKKISYDSTNEASNQRLKKINSNFLLFFLIFIISVLVFNTLTELISDFGFWDWKFHITYYHNPGAEGNHPSYLDPYYSIPQDQWKYHGLSSNDPIWDKWNVRLIRQPNVFWPLTQFTWITTFLVLLTVIFRFFKFEEYMPKKLKWLIDHNTLFFIALMDTVVMVVFWSVLLKSSNKNFNDDTTLRSLKIVSTILVHACIPIILIGYTAISGIKDPEAEQLNKKFFLYGTIVIFSYLLFYIMVAFAWDDPYAPFTHLHQGKGWWQIAVLVPIMEIVLLGGYFFNGWFIRTFNKNYHKKVLTTKELKVNKK